MIRELNIKVESTVVYTSIKSIEGRGNNVVDVEKKSNWKKN